MVNVLLVIISNLRGRTNKYVHMPNGSTCYSSLVGSRLAWLFVNVMASANRSEEMSTNFFWFSNFLVFIPIRKWIVSSKIKYLCMFCYSGMTLCSSSSRSPTCMRLMRCHREWMRNEGEKKKSQQWRCGKCVKADRLNASRLGYFLVLEIETLWFAWITLFW